MSFLMRLTRTLLRLRPNVFRSEQAVRASLAKSHPGDAPVPRRLQRSCQVSRSIIDGNAVITLTPRQGSSGCELLYIHGGAFTPSFRRTGKLSGSLSGKRVQRLPYPRMA